MKIIQLAAENIKKISAIDITPTDNLIEITGKNGHGKSSVLDSIWYALGGTKNHPELPIKDGEKSAQITLDLGEYKVVRRFTEKGTTLTVKNSEGASFSSPQNLLDKMIGDLSFDPLEFANMKQKEQFDRLKNICGLGNQIESVEECINDIYNKRTELNREIKSISAQVEAINVPEGTPDETIDTLAVLEEIEKRTAYNDRTIGTKQEIEGFKRQIIEIEDTISRVRQMIGSRIETAERPIMDIENLKQSLKDSQQINENVSNKKRKNTLLTQMHNHELASNNATKEIESLQAKKQTLIENANMPINGLMLEDGNVYFNNVPLSQCSSAEQLKISISIAMAANPTLRVLRVKDGSLLDDENMQILRSIAKDHDYQVWIETVHSKSDSAIVMEDGHIKQ